MSAGITFIGLCLECTDGVKCIQWFCERLDFIRIVHNRKLKFCSRLCCSPNDVVSQCFNWFLYSNEF